MLASHAAIPIRFMDVALTQAVASAANLDVYAYHAYVIASAVNHRAPILTLDSGLKASARKLNIEVLEVSVQ